MKGDGFYKTGFFVLLVGVALGVGFYFGQNQNKNLSFKKEITPSVAISPPLQPTNSPIPTKIEREAVVVIKELLANKHNKPLSDTQVTISKKDDTHIQGGVKFAGEIAGAWFLAVKDSNGQWVIVDEGNGTISCEKIAPYNFPSSMVKECVNASGKLIKR